METRFKQTSRTARVVLQEQPFLNGMNYTNAPLPDGNCRLLVNYEQTTNNTGLRPRRGAKSMFYITPSLLGLKEGETFRLITPLYYLSQINGYQALVEIERDDIPNYYILSVSQSYDEWDTSLTPITGFFPPLPGSEVIDFTNSGFFINAIAEETHVQCIVHSASGVVLPKKLTATEAARWGFNMLSEDPYTFESSDSTVASRVNFDGFLPYSISETPKLVLNPIIGVEYNFKLFSQVGPGTYAIRIRWRGLVNDAWQDITNTYPGLSVEELKNYAINFTPTQEATIIQIKIYAKYVDDAWPVSDAYLEAKWDFSNADAEWYPTPNSTYIYRHYDSYGNLFYYHYNSVSAKWETVYYPQSEDATEESLFRNGFRNILTNAVSFNFTKQAQQINKDSDLKKYELSLQCAWKNRLVALGLRSGVRTTNQLLISDVDDPSYFPYPNNLSSFPEPIIKAIPFQDDLLVFTNTQIWRLVLSSDGLTWTQTCIQKNLDFTKNAKHIHALSTMVFFKSGFKYYLLVPSSKGTGELVVANISRNLEDLFIDVPAFIKQTVIDVYGETFKKNYNELCLEVPTYDINTFIEESKIHITYHFDIAADYSDAYQKYAYSKTAEGSVILTYDTSSRLWSITILEHQGTLDLIKVDALNTSVWAVSSNDTPKFNVVDRYNNEYATTFKLQNIFRTTYDASGQTEATLDLNITQNIPKTERTPYIELFYFSDDDERTDLLHRTNTNLLPSTRLNLDYTTLQKYELPGAPDLSNGVVISTEPPKEYNYSAYDLYSALIEMDIVSEITFDASYINLTAEPQTEDGKTIAASRTKLTQTNYCLISVNDGTYTFKKANILKTTFTTDGVVAKQVVTHPTDPSRKAVIWYYPNWVCTAVTIETIYNANPLFDLYPANTLKNYQYLDTGNRNINVTLNKKIREYIIDINNMQNAPLQFYTEFLLDKQIKKPLYSGTVVAKLTDAFEESTAYLDYSAFNEQDLEVPGTVLSLTNGLEYQLGRTTWSQPYIAKLRAPVTSKGYLPRLRILSKNEKLYELRTISWVYRNLNGR